MAETVPLWRPSPDQAARTQVFALMQKVGGIVGRRFRDYREFHAFTIDHRDLFWSVAWDEFGVIVTRVSGFWSTTSCRAPGSFPTHGSISPRTCFGERTTPRPWSSEERTSSSGV